MRRARKLHEQHNGSQDFAKQCPCTTVYLLVEELNKYLK
ncbi:RloB domain-containing protein [Chitinophaga sp. Cy-1792]|nr:RloB domain-containing protein [Chitinophaga sp. Cy-1792]